MFYHICKIVIHVSNTSILSLTKPTRNGQGKYKSHFWLDIHNTDFRQDLLFTASIVHSSYITVHSRYTAVHVGSLGVQNKLKVLGNVISITDDDK